MARPNQTESAGCLRPISQQTPKADRQAAQQHGELQQAASRWPRSLDQLVDLGHRAKVSFQAGLRFSVKAVTPSCAQPSIMFTAMVWPASW